VETKETEIKRAAMFAAAVLCEPEDSGDAAKHRGINRSYGGKQNNSAVRRNPK